MRGMHRVAGSRSVCYAPWMHRSRLRLTLRETRGVSIVEVLAVTVIVGIAVIGVALMFGKGSAWVMATGADRVAAGLAQQGNEQIRAGGWNAATAADPLAECPGLPGAPPLPTGLGVLPEEPLIQAGNKHSFTRTLCIQYVDGDPTSPGGLAEPPFTSACLPGTASSMVR